MPKDPTAHKGRRPAKLSQQLLEKGQGFQRCESMDKACALAELLGFMSYVASSSISRAFPQAAKLTLGSALVSADGVVPCLGIATSAP